MTDQNAIPAEKVRELAAKYDGDMPTDPHFLLGEIKADLRALLPTQQPTTGLLGRWAKHPEHGDVVCVWDEPMEGHITVHYRYKDERTGTLYDQVPLDSLTFPHQTTRPEDVQPGEAWLVDVEDSEESHKSIVALKYACDDWRTSDGVTNCSFWDDNEVTLISPLTPERPGKDDLVWKYASLQQDYAHLEKECSDLQARYDALDAKYREAQARIKTLEQLKPAWRIEHDPDNLRVGEFIIDIGGDDGTLTRKWGSYWDIDGDTYVAPCFAPFIAFTNKDAATPEAIEEAMKERDKEMKK